jgi:hypothetical protein
MTKHERFAMLNKIRWHGEYTPSDETSRACICGYTIDKTAYASSEKFDNHIKKNNPTFKTIESVLSVAISWEDWFDFFRTVGSILEDEGGNVKSFEIDLCYIFDPERLLDKAIEWRESHKKEGTK